MTATFLLITFILPLLNGVPIGPKDFNRLLTHSSTRHLDNYPSFNLSTQSYDGSTVDENLNDKIESFTKKTKDEEEKKAWSAEFNQMYDKKEKRAATTETTSSTLPLVHLNETTTANLTLVQNVTTKRTLPLKTPKERGEDDDDVDKIQTNLTTTEKDETKTDKSDQEAETVKDYDDRLNATSKKSTRSYVRFFTVTIPTVILFGLLLVGLCFLTRRGSHCCSHFTRPPYELCKHQQKTVNAVKRRYALTEEERAKIKQEERDKLHKQKEKLIRKKEKQTEEHQKAKYKRQEYREKKSDKLRDKQHKDVEKLISKKEKDKQMKQKKKEQLEKQRHDLMIKKDRRDERQMKQGDNKRGRKDKEAKEDVKQQRRELEEERARSARERKDEIEREKIRKAEEKREKERQDAIKNESERSRSSENLKRRPPRRLSY